MRRAAVLAALLIAAGCGKDKIRSPAELPGMGADSARSGGRKAPYAVLRTARGEIVVRLLPEEAPKAVANFTELASGKKEWRDPRTGKPLTRPLYDGTLFFRVIPGFLIQGGDPSDTGSGGPGYALEPEIYPGRSLEKPGVLALAGAGGKASGSQFFLTVGQAPWLDGKHTVIGVVSEGLAVAEAIARAPRRELDPRTGRLVDRPLDPVRLEQVVIEER